MDEMVCLGILRFFMGVIVLMMLDACEERATLAPVIEYNWHKDHGGVTKHKVLPGETLYAVAFRYEMDYRQLAAINHMHPPYRLQVGQTIYLVVPRASRSPSRVGQQRYVLSRKASHKMPWVWPAPGAVVTSFAPQRGQKGIDIIGHRQQAIVASAAGTVAYAGDGLLGYGNLILLKHPHHYLSAYAYNARNLVKLGQKVAAGQIIAIMGMKQKEHYAVHFELRQFGRPIDPGMLLPIRSGRPRTGVAL